MYKSVQILCSMPNISLLDIVPIDIATTISVFDKVISKMENLQLKETDKVINDEMIRYYTTRLSGLKCIPIIQVEPDNTMESWSQQNIIDHAEAILAQNFINICYTNISSPIPKHIYRFLLHNWWNRQINNDFKLRETPT